MSNQKKEEEDINEEEEEEEDDSEGDKKTELENKKKVDNINNNEKEEKKEKEEIKEEKKGEEDNDNKGEEDKNNINNEYILFDRNKIKNYWKNQKPPKAGLFLDQLFPPIAEILYDKKMKNEGVEKINIHQIDFRKSTEIFKKKELTLFPPININTKEINFEINIKENEGDLINDYSHFFHAIKILTKYPGLIKQIFKSEKINQDGFYELYIYTNGQFKILILDDYFPIIKGSNNILRFSKPIKSEIWLLLLEKAFAKLNGGYGSLFSCNISHVIQTFTGFPIERLYFYDLLDIEDLEDIIRINKSLNIINLCPKKEICEEIGIIPGRAYIVKDIYDIRNDNNGKEECLKIIKLENIYEYNKYKGEWSSNGSLFTQNIKEIVGYDSNNNENIYMSIEYIYKYFDRIEIIYPNFDNNIKLIKIENNKNENNNIMNNPQIFNLYIPFKSLVSISLINRTNILDMETTNYEKDFTTYEKINPCMICYSQYDPDNKTFKYFEGSFHSFENPELCRELKKGYYIIYTWLLYDKCNEPKPDEYYLKVSSKTNFKLRHQAQDLNINNNILYNMIFNSIKLNQGQFMKNDEIFYMNDNNYNFTGLGLKFVLNPFNDCYQKWTFPELHLDNMIIIYPPNFENNKEIIIGPNNSHLLIYGIKIDSKKEGKFNIKSIFKTFKYKSNLNIQENKEPLFINFYEFCSKDIKDEILTSEYYQYLSLNPILKEIENSEDEIIEKLNIKYPEQMKKINDLQSKLNIKEESQLRYKEINEENGIFIGQVNSNNEKNGRGAFILNESKNCKIGYWDNNIMKGEGIEYDKNWNKIEEGTYDKGNINGIGMRILKDGTKYEGLFLNGNIEGKGIYTFPDGTKWEGNSINGKKEGKGILTQKDGNQIEIEYKNDIRIEQKKGNNNVNIEKDNKKEEILNNNNNETKEEKKEEKKDEKKEEEESEEEEEEEKKEEKKEEEKKEEKKEEEKKEEKKEEEKKDEKKEEKKEEDKKEEKKEEKKDEEEGDDEEEEEEEDDEN